MPEKPRVSLKKSSEDLALLLDTSAFIAGYEVSSVKAEHYSIPSVRDELKDGELARLRFDNAARSGRLKVLSPDPRYMDEVRVVGAKMGEEGVLSDTDTQLLALGIKLKADGLEPIVVSDDYSVQNVANRLGLSFRGLSTRGIKREFEWVIYCPGCRRTFHTPQTGNACPVCGTMLKRRPDSKRPIRI